MSKERFYKMLIYFQKFYPSYLKSDDAIQDVIDKYYDFLKGYEETVIYNSILLRLKESSYFPSISEILQKTKRAEIIIEAQKNWIEQDARNRCYIPSNYRLEDDWVFQVGVKAGF